ncbi:hypothetical protein GUJ93_ZPchr0005g16196 [Zizania palustris]|uniref:Uncharacterized protein n=1 Tax=Zizania palustris TaxID=103762 RepID=A0A8J5SKU2_ZIZPA|nr:hypothetical protein GUJ93_ZPchr0005g16196 [Zizania palustris]
MAPPRHLLLSILAAASLTTLAAAVYGDQVGLADWYDDTLSSSDSVAFRSDSPLPCPRSGSADEARRIVEFLLLLYLPKLLVKLDLQHLKKLGSCLILLMLSLEAYFTELLTMVLKVLFMHENNDSYTNS